jgi:hypothetical protein
MKKAYYQLLEISEALRVKAQESAVYIERYNGVGWERKKTEHTSTVLRDDEGFVQLSHGWIDRLSRTAREFVMLQIFPRLRQNNLLWHHPSPMKSSERTALAELTGVGILFRTEVAGIYIVNPTKLWKGGKISATECTKQLLREHKTPSTALIRDLRPRAAVDRDCYNLLKEGFTPRLLEEAPPPEPYGGD